MGSIDVGADLREWRVLDRRLTMTHQAAKQNANATKTTNLGTVILCRPFPIYCAGGV